MERTRMINRGKEMKQALLNRTKESHDRRDDTGMYKDVFLNIEGLQKWKCKEGVHLIDIIPYRAGDKDPNTKPGEWTYLLDLWVHGNVGPNQDSYVCPARTYNAPCPICEHREELREADDYDEELVRTLYPIRRVIYNIICYDDPKEESKGVQVWMVSHFHMEKRLMAIAKLPARGGTGGGYVAFADPDEGRSIQFERKGGRNNTEYLGHQFISRDGYTISDEILLSAYQLDQIVHVPTYEELHDAFFGSRLKATVEEKGVVDSAEVDEMDKSPDVKSKTPPQQQSTVTSRLKPTPKFEQNEFCPGGGVFGVDCEDLEDCGNCPVWDDCSAKKDEIRAEEASAKSATPDRPKSSKSSTAPRPSATGGRPLVPRGRLS